MTEQLPDRAPEQVEHADGRVELAPGVVLSDPRLVNEDLAPTTIAKRTWSTYTFAALWISMAHCIPTYMMASGLISKGMSWWQALVTILVGNVIVLVPILLNSHAGTKYGIPFPVFARASYGVYGANVPAIMRALVACGWFGINCWIGGEALDTLFAAFFPGWRTLFGDATFQGYLFGRWICFLLFWGLNILVIYRGMELLRKVENLAAPYVLVMTAALLGWAVWKAGGLGAILDDKGTLGDFSSFWPVFVPNVTAMIGFWATLSLNMPDFTRFGRSQKEQTVGQVVALPTTMALFSAMGIVITSAAREIYKDAATPKELEDMWNPIVLVGKFDNRPIVAIATFTIVVATLAVNIAANVVSPANDFSNLAPKRISFKTGGLITGVLGILCMPWKLLENQKVYINGWLQGYGVGLASIAGVLITDYWIIRKKRLKLADLYRKDGAYRGASLPAILATVLGCAVAWSGLLVSELQPLFDYGWFVATAVSGSVYWALMKLLRRLPGAAAAPNVSP
jgi:NCS1 family nucleobase:cation symporter-1